jgi:putative solute:sodium symporter small subunit
MADPDSSQQRRRDYWRENLRIMAWLLAVWFLVSYGCGIIFVDVLNKISLGGFQLGFWMAQQGSIYVFVVLIFVYVRLMNKLDKKYGFDKEDESESDKKEDA